MIRGESPQWGSMVHLFEMITGHHCYAHASYKRSKTNGTVVGRMANVECSILCAMLYAPQGGEVANVCKGSMICGKSVESIELHESV